MDNFTFQNHLNDHLETEQRPAVGLCLTIRYEKTRKGEWDIPEDLKAEEGVEGEALPDAS